MKYINDFHTSTNVIFNNTLLSIFTGMIFVYLGFYTFLPMIIDFSLVMAALLTAVMLVVFTTIMVKLSYLTVSTSYEFLKGRTIEVPTFSFMNKHSITFNLR